MIGKLEEISLELQLRAMTKMSVFVYGMVIESVTSRHTRSYMILDFFVSGWLSIYVLVKLRSRCGGTEREPERR